MRDRREQTADQPHVVVQRQPGVDPLVAPDSERRRMAWMFAQQVRWVSSTPLGRPVLPEVYWMSAVSSPLAGSGSAQGPGPACAGR